MLCYFWCVRPMDVAKAAPQNDPREFLSPCTVSNAVEFFPMRQGDHPLDHKILDRMGYSIVPIYSTVPQWL